MNREENIKGIENYLSKDNSIIFIPTNEYVLNEFETGTKEIIRVITKGSILLNIYNKNNQLLNEYEKEYESMTDDEIEYIARIVEDYETEFEKTMKRIED